MPSKHDAHVCKKGCTFKTALTRILETCLWAYAGGDWRVIVYFIRQVVVRPDGWAYIGGGAVIP